MPPSSPVAPASPIAPVLAPGQVLIAPTAPLAPNAPMASVSPFAPAVSPTTLTAHPSGAPSQFPSNKPSSAPTEFCVRSSINFLNCNTLTNRTLSVDGTTQEDKSMKWVVEDDPSLLPNTEANQLSLLQRYALATMQVNGEGWSGSECNWIGVLCDANQLVVISTCNTLF